MSAPVVATESKAEAEPLGSTRAAADSVSRIFRNFLWLVFGNGTGQILAFVTNALIARAVGVDWFGKLAFAQVLATYLGLLTDAGLRIEGTKLLAREKGSLSSHLANILTLRTAALGLALLALGLFLLLSDIPASTKKLILLFSISAALTTYWLDWAFQGLEQMALPGLSKILQYGTYFFLCLLFVRHAEQAFRAPIFLALGTLLAVVVTLLVFLRKYGRGLTWTPQPNLWRGILQRAMPLGMSIILIQVYYRINIVMLSFMTDDRTVGLYGAASDPVFLMSGAAGLAATAFLPTVARAYHEGREKVEAILNQTTATLVTLGVPLGVGGTLLAKDIISTLYGTQFLGSVLGFQILIWSTLIIFVSVNYGTPLIACDHHNRYLLGVGVGALTNITLNLVLIPRLGLLGACVTTVSTELIVLIYMRRQLEKFLTVRLLPKLARPLASSVVMALLLCAGWSRAWLPYRILLGLAVYFAVLIGLGGVDLSIIRASASRSGNTH